MRYSGGDCYEYQFRNVLYFHFIFFNFLTGFMLVGKHLELCTVVRWERFFMLTNRAARQHHFHLSHAFGSPSALSCSPTEPPRIQLCYRRNLESLIPSVRSCCLITAVWLMSNLFLAQNGFGLFFFFFLQTLESPQSMSSGCVLQGWRVGSQVLKISISIELC